MNFSIKPLLICNYLILFKPNEANSFYSRFNELFTKYLKYSPQFYAFFNPYSVTSLFFNYYYSLKNSTVKLSYLLITLKMLNLLLVFLTGLGFKSEVKEVVFVGGLGAGLGAGLGGGLKLKSEVNEEVLVGGLGAGLGVGLGGGLKFKSEVKEEDFLTGLFLL